MTSGDKLGPFEIVALIGRGGLGEVYRSRGTRVRREVAIKVATQRFSERFERAAKVIAARRFGSCDGTGQSHGNGLLCCGRLGMHGACFGGLAGEARRGQADDHRAASPAGMRAGSEPPKRRLQPRLLPHQSLVLYTPS
jgi:hypothetical protein